MPGEVLLLGTEIHRQPKRGVHGSNFFYLSLPIFILRMLVTSMRNNGEPETGMQMQSLTQEWIGHSSYRYNLVKNMMH